MTKDKMISSDSVKTEEDHPQRAYTPPKIISAEKLEASAATCSTPPPASVSGKTVGLGLCQTSGS